MAEDGHDMTSEALKAVAVDMLSILSRLDLDALRDRLAEDVVMEFPYAFGAIPPRVAGRDAVVETVGGIAHIFAALRFAAQAVHAAPGRGCVIVEADGEGTWADGRPYANRYAMLFTVRDGRVTHWREFFDPLKLGGGAASAETEGVQ